MSEHENSQSQENPAPQAESAEEYRDDYKFGSWPEVAGLVFTALVSWLIVVFTG